MKNSDLKVSVPGPSGQLILHMDFTPERRIEKAWAETNTDVTAQSILEWLGPWLSGHDMPYAYENVAEAFLEAFPTLPWNWSEVPQEIVRQALYQTHPKVQIERQERIVCKCHKVTDFTIKNILNANTVKDVSELTILSKAGSGCGSCRGELEQILIKSRPAARRWHGEPFATWIVKTQDSLNAWQKRARFTWAMSKSMTVTGFKDGVVYIHIAEGLTADQEWELTQALTDYWAEGFPEPLSLFLDFSLL